jgi:hypothetical protein
VLGPFDEGAIVTEIDALERSLAKADSPSATKRSEKEARAAQFTLVPLNAPEQRLCSLYLRYTSDGSREDLRRDFRQRHVQLLMRRNHIDEAAEAAAAFVVDHADHALAVSAAEMLVDALTIQSFVENDPAARERLLEWVERLPTLPVWHHPQAEPLRTTLPRLRAGVLSARARAARDADPPDYEACARDYDAALEPNVGQPIDMLLLGAAECLELAGDHEGGAARREQLQRRVPQSVRDRP